MYVAQAMRTEHERLVVSLLAVHLKEAGLLVSAGQQDKYRHFMMVQFSPVAQELGWEPRPGDTDEQKILRAGLLAVLGEAGDSAAMTAARNIVEQYLRQPGSTDGTITGAAFSVAAANGDADLYQTLTTALGKTTSTDEYYNYLFALADFRRPELVERTLQLISNGRVRQQDYPAFFAAMLANPVSSRAAWSYLKSHWDELAQKVTSFGGRGAVSALGNFCSVQEKDDVKQFFATHHAPGAERALQQSLEAIDNCIQFKQLQQAKLEVWLAKQ
jgi:ERAP1-like protein